MTGALVFDGTGAPVSDGDRPLTDFDLRDWPACHIVGSGDVTATSSVDLIILLDQDGSLGLSHDAIVHSVATLDGGGAVAFHGADPRAALTAAAAVFLLLGGGHA
jgi:hypothetical protein